MLTYASRRLRFSVNLYFAILGRLQREHCGTLVLPIRPNNPGGIANI